MTRSELFRAAHALARATRQAGDDYRTTFAAALRYLSSVAKAAKAAPIVEGVSRWTKNGRDRLYINYASQNRFRQDADYIDLASGRYVATEQYAGAWTRNAIRAFRDQIAA